MIWPVNWELSAESGKFGGWIIQEVQVWLKTSQGEWIKAVDPANNSNNNYYEAWDVAKNDTKTVNYRNLRNPAANMNQIRKQANLSSLKTATTVLQFAQQQSAKKEYLVVKVAAENAIANGNESAANFGVADDTFAVDSAYWKFGVSSNLRPITGFKTVGSVIFVQKNSATDKLPACRRAVLFGPGLVPGSGTLPSMPGTPNNTNKFYVWLGAHAHSWPTTHMMQFVWAVNQQGNTVITVTTDPETKQLNYF